MAKTITKSVNSGNKKEVVKNYSKKPKNFEVYFYSSSENPMVEWRNFQKHVKHRYPIAKRVRNFIKVLADDFQLKPQVVAFLEDCFRGFSIKMQLSMFSTIHNYICYNDLITTGVVHTDKLIRDMLCKIYNNKI